MVSQQNEGFEQLRAWQIKCKWPHSFHFFLLHSSLQLTCSHN